MASRPSFVMPALLTRMWAVPKSAFYIKEICSTFQDQLPPDIPADDVSGYFVSMCRELVRFVSKHETMVRNVLDSNVYPVLFDSMAEFVSDDILHILRRMNLNESLTPFQLEGMVVFYAGGMLSTLRQFLKRGEPIDEEQFIGIIGAFFRPEELSGNQ